MLLRVILFFRIFECCIGRLFNCNDRCFFIWREAPKPKCLPGLVRPFKVWFQRWPKKGSDSTWKFLCLRSWKLSIAGRSGILDVLGDYLTAMTGLRESRLWWKVHLAYPATLQALHPILRNKEFKYNIRLLKIPTGRRHPVGYLQAWPRIWTREDREQILQVARAWLEPGTAGLRVRRADHSATLPPN